MDSTSDLSRDYDQAVADSQAVSDTYDQATRDYDQASRDYQAATDSYRRTARNYNWAMGIMVVGSILFAVFYNPKGRKRGKRRKDRR